MVYYAKITRQKGGGYLVEFPDLPGCLTEGDTMCEAKAYAREALNGWLSVRCDRNLNIPTPTAPQGKTYVPIPVDLNVEFPIQLRTTRKKKRLTQQHVAHRLGMSQQAYAKLETPSTSNPTLKTIQKISEVLHVEIGIALAA